jgi:predicted PurR-regulated permease PerM
MAADLEDSDPRPGWRVHPLVERLGAYSWRLIAIGIVAWAILHLIDQLRLVLLPVVVATMLAVVLAVPAEWLRSHGAPPLVAAWTCVGGFLAVVALVGFLVVPSMVDEFADLGPTIEDAYQDVEDWLVEDSPFDVDRARLEELEEQARDAAGNAVSGSSSVVVQGAVLLFEMVAALVLALVLTFFFVKDGERFQRWALSRVHDERRDVARRVANRGWSTLGGYLRGSALLGVIEGIIIGVTLWLTGASLIIPVALITFAAAFVPFVGAVVAGVLAVAVALATAGPGAALVVGIVALIVQQFDNDLLAPVVFGRTLDLHPVVILLVIASGGALAGLMGVFLAVPTAAIVLNVLAELHDDDGGLLPSAEDAAEVSASR